MLIEGTKFPALCKICESQIKQYEKTYIVITFTGRVVALSISRIFRLAAEGSVDEIQVEIRADSVEEF